jgi:hypothetical protein
MDTWRTTLDARKKCRIPRNGIMRLLRFARNDGTVNKIMI